MIQVKNFAELAGTIVSQSRLDACVAIRYCDKANDITRYGQFLNPVFSFLLLMPLLSNSVDLGL